MHRIPRLRGIPVVVLSGYGVPADRARVTGAAEYVSKPFEEYVSKPFEPDALLAMVSTYVHWAR